MHPGPAVKLYRGHASQGAGGKARNERVSYTCSRRLPSAGKRPAQQIRGEEVAPEKISPSNETMHSHAESVQKTPTS
jgi:hypothetical protein